MADYIQIKASVIRWACDRIGIIYSELSTRDFKGLEREKDGVVNLTLKQAEKLAKVLRYPFVYLLLDSPVTDIDKLPINDFRSINSEEVRPSINLKEQIEYCQSQQDWFSDYVKNCGIDTFEYNGKYSLNEQPQEAGQQIRDFLKISYKDSKNAKEYLTKLKEIFENNCILVSSSKVLRNTNHRLKLSEFRGFSLYDRDAPLIFINRNDSDTAQIFTLCHELGHICLGESGVSDVARDNIKKTERWCNEFAANILMPKKDVIDVFNRYDTVGHFLESAVKVFHVSVNAMLVRIYNLSLIDKNTFDIEWEKAEEQYHEYLNSMHQSKGSSGGNYFHTVRSRSSGLLLQSLISSTSVGETTFRDAAYLLGLKSVSVFDKLVKKGAD
ncbi:MAG: ImmA/IrrE family metallo-endopeptidase [Succinivibrio sp.]